MTHLTDPPRPRAERGADAPAAPIDRAYLLAVNIPCARDGQGRHCVDALWHQDLIEHLRYLPRLALAAPLATGPCPDGHRALPGPGEGPGGGGVEHVDLSHPRSMARALVNLPADLWRMWRAVGRAQVVHTGVAGWPLPAGWLAAPIARLRGRFLIVNVESAHWRLRPEERARASWRRRLRADWTEWMARRVVCMADFPMFTQEQYRTGLLPAAEAERGPVLPASWINDEDVLDESQAASAWDRRNARPGAPLALVCASKLVPAKGILVLMEAMRRLAERGVPAALDLYGAGELEAECARLAAAIPPPVTVRMRGLVPYGAPFFRTLHEYQLLVSPLISDEQPRIVYDAFSQALPVLGSDTPGQRQCLRVGVDGELVPVGDAEALARGIAELAADRERLRRYGLAALEAARGWTHRAMHERRWRLLEAALAARPGRAGGVRS